MENGNVTRDDLAVILVGSVASILWAVRHVGLEKTLEDLRNSVPDTSHTSYGLETYTQTIAKLKELREYNNGNV